MERASSSGMVQPRRALRAKAAFGRFTRERIVKPHTQDQVDCGLSSHSRILVQRRFVLRPVLMRKRN